MKTNQQAPFTKAGRFVASLLVFLSLGLPAQSTNFNLQATQATADQGDAKAQYALASYYVKGGIGIPKDYAKAAQYLRQAADQGLPEAQIALGSMYGRGHGVPRNVATAVSWYRKAADQGNPLAQYAMGNFYATGRGVTNDLDQAVKWWQKAAGQNQMDAEAALGQLFLLPTPPYGNRYVDFAAAHRWLQQAAAQGSPGAMNNLGVAYENGLGVHTDFKEAARWYRSAADQGNALAQANLGQLYFDGRGVPYDLVQSYKWFKLSASQANSLGNNGLQTFQTHSLLSPKQLADAEQMVLDYRPQPPKTQP